MNDHISTHVKIPEGSKPDAPSQVQVTHLPCSEDRDGEFASAASSNVAESGDDAVPSAWTSFSDFDQEQIAYIAHSVPGGVQNIRDVYPLSPLQEGMLFHHLLNPENDTYLLSTLFALRSDDDVRAMVQALQRVLDRHDILRTSFLWDKVPHPVQVVCHKATLTAENVDIDHDASAFEILRQRMRPQGQTFDLTRAPLMRLLVAKDTRTAEWYGLLQVHHLICDYQSVRTAIEEMYVCLNAQEQLLPTPMAYRHYVAKLLEQARTLNSQEFFRDKLADVDEPTAPFGLCDVHGDGSKIREAREAIEFSLSQQIRVQARRSGVSAARLFHAAWSLVIAHTSGKDDVVFGTVLSVARQKSTATERLLGMSINTLPLRLRLQGVTAKELVDQTHRELLDLLKHAATSLTTVQRCSGINGTAPLFTAILNYRRSASNESKLQNDTDGIRELAYRGAWTNYPVALQVDDLGERFILMTQTDVHIDPHRMIGYMRTVLQSLTDALERAPETPALALTILPPDERRQILKSFNTTSLVFSKEKLIHELFEEQAQRAADAVAVVCGDRQLTYGQLNRRANAVARALLQRGVRPDERVCLHVERCVDMVAGLLGILKAGGAYVPLDISHPRERLEYVLRDSSPTVLLTQELFKHVLTAQDVQVLTLEAVAGVDSPEADSNARPDEIRVQPQHLTYLVYTSGSTGAPKGVMVEHRNLLNLVHWHCDAFDLRPGVRSSSVAAMGFDAAGWEIWPPLSIGATLVLAPAEVVTDPEKLIAWWGEQPLDISFLPTPLAEFVFSQNIHNPQLRTLLVGGDRLRYRPASASFALVNNYGPTESTVVATSGQIQDNDAVLHIGRPIGNTQVYILDSRQQPVPLGVIGELYIGGSGVARGYLHRPELTQERFVTDFFSTDPDARLYKTGDLARWIADGTVQYCGRNDHQVKIHGYRIELGEIEARLTQHPLIKDAVVIAWEDVPGQKQLIAYITQRENVSPQTEELRTHLRTVLPGYMIPTAFVCLERLPLTPNGKLERRALPAPELEVHASKYEPPQGKVEEILAQIWQQLLQLDRVGRRDNFFEGGGHSLLAVKMLFHINKTFDCTLKVTDIYGNPSLQELALRIAGIKKDDEFVELLREATLDPAIVTSSIFRHAHAEAILLTGATGFVGRFLLAQLLSDTTATIYCLVRAPSEHQARSRLLMTLADWDLWQDKFEHRIVAIAGDLRQSKLGVNKGAYRTLTDHVDCIYHCATDMNHLETYEMAKAANVGSARELLRLATQGKPKLINFISTLGIFNQPSGMVRLVDELTTIDRERHFNSRGYVASKWVAEKIFMTATQRGIPCNIFRLGLVWADTQQGRYDELQNVYRIFKTCLLTGLGIENYQYLMAPTPVDYVAQATVSLAHRHSGGGGIFHISASGGAQEGVFERCNEVAGTSLRILPHYDWILEIKREHEAGRSLPALPLIQYAFCMDERSFYEHQSTLQSTRPRIDCTRTHRELESCGIVAPELSDALLKTCVESMFSRDEDLRAMQGVETDAPATGRRSSRSTSRSARVIDRQRSPAP